MDYLKSDVKDLVDMLKPTLKKELDFIKSNDWTSGRSRGKRIKMENLHSLITDRAVKNAEKLYKQAEGFTDHKSVSNVLEMCIEMYDIYEDRYNKYTSKEDWTKYLDKGKKEEDVEEEIEFQSDIRKNLTSMKSHLRKINFGNESNNINLSLFNDRVVSIAMRDTIEERYPEIKEYIELRKNTESKTKKE